MKLLRKFYPRENVKLICVVLNRHGKKIRIRGYPSESVPTLTGNTRVDRVWVRVRVFPDNQKSGTGTSMGLLDPSRPRTRTRLAT